MKQHEKENYENETFYSTTSSTTSLDKVSNFSLDITKTYEVSSLEREEMTKRLIKDDVEYKYNVARGKNIYDEVNKYGMKEKNSVLCEMLHL